MHDAAVVVGADGGDLARGVPVKVAAPSRCYIRPVDRHVLIPVNDDIRS